MPPTETGYQFQVLDPETFTAEQALDWVREIAADLGSVTDQARSRLDQLSADVWQLLSGHLSFDRKENPSTPMQLATPQGVASALHREVGAVRERLMARHHSLGQSASSASFLSTSSDFGSPDHAAAAC